MNRRSFMKKCVGSMLAVTAIAVPTKAKTHNSQEASTSVDPDSDWANQSIDLNSLPNWVTRELYVPIRGIIREGDFFILSIDEKGHYYVEPIHQEDFYKPMIDWEDDNKDHLIPDGGSYQPVGGDFSLGFD